MSILVFGLSALALMAAPPAAQPSTADQQDTTRNAGDRLICKKEDTLGSRLGAKKVCLTAHEWKVLAQENREHTEDVQREAGFTRSN